MFFRYFKNKKIIVTGHTGFKGSWLSFWLYLNGAKVIGVDFKSKKNNPNLLFFIKINLDHKTEIDKLTKVLNTKFKKIDILINNAGYVSTSDIDKVTNSKI